MKVSKVFRAFVIVFVIIMVLFAKSTFAHASVPENRNKCICAVMRMRTYIRINHYSRSNTVKMRKGGQKQLTYCCSRNLRGKRAVWSSSNNRVVTVANGKLKAKRKGTAVITVRIGNYSASCVVRVQR